MWRCGQGLGRLGRPQHLVPASSIELFSQLSDCLNLSHQPKPQRDSETGFPDHPCDLQAHAYLLELEVSPVRNSTR